jgi:hypothetical protein
MKGVRIKEFCEGLETAMKGELESIAREASDALQRIAKSRSVVSGKIEAVKRFVHDYSFRDATEQIEFFKEIKPVFLSQYFYYDRLFTFTVNRPTEKVELVAHCQAAQTEIRQYTALHKDFLGYCLSGATDMDEFYFVVHKAPVFNPLEDSQFTTNHDLPLSIYLANRLLHDHIENVLKELQTGQAPSQLTWTSKKAYLVELLYAFHEAHVFNNGKADIKDIASLFETQFNTNLGNYYRHFVEITARKTNRTNFIDLLKEKLTRRLNEADY